MDRRSLTEVVDTDRLIAKMLSGRDLLALCTVNRHHAALFDDDDSVWWNQIVDEAMIDSSPITLHRSTRLVYAKLSVWEPMGMLRVASEIEEPLLVERLLNTERYEAYELFEAVQATTDSSILRLVVERRPDLSIGVYCYDPLLLSRLLKAAKEYAIEIDPYALLDEAIAMQSDRLIEPLLDYIHSDDCFVLDYESNFALTTICANNRCAELVRAFLTSRFDRPDQNAIRKAIKHNASSIIEQFSRWGNVKEREILKGSGWTLWL